MADVTHLKNNPSKPADVSESQLLPALKELIGFLNIEIRVDRFLSRRWFFRARHKVVVYLRKLISIAAEAAVLTGIVWLFCTFLLYIANIFWRLYQQTLMGRQYLEYFPLRVQMINEIFEYKASYLAGEATFSAFVICIGLGAVGHFLHINQHFYLSRGFFGKLLFWGAGLTALVTYYLYTQYGFSSWKGVVVVAAVPTCCLFWNCYDYAERLLPELGDIFRWIAAYWEKMKRLVTSALE